MSMKKIVSTNARISVWSIENEKTSQTFTSNRTSVFTFYPKRTEKKDYTDDEKQRSNRFFRFFYWCCSPCCCGLLLGCLTSSLILATLLALWLMSSDKTSSHITSIITTTIVCNPICQNGGNCTGLNTCTCTSQWTDATCSTPVCSPACSNGGTCSSPNVCTCTTYWGGSTCTTPVCTPACSNGGTCIGGVNNCTCPSTWTDLRCTTPVCNPPCQNGGTCISPSTCSCTPQWTDATCSTPICSPSCSNGGTCSSPNVCTCTTYWGGSTCTTPVCTPTCSNGGTCVGGTNVCTCPSGWTDTKCTTPVCYPSCQNGGTCSSPDVCTCPTYWNGSSCSIPVCIPACQNGGTCNGGVNNCNCPMGYSGSYCQNSPSCFYGKDMVRLVNGGERSIENLQVGDRIWSISRYGTILFEDEVFLMPDNGPNKSALFYTFKTKDGHEVSLTGNHSIFVYLPQINEIHYLRASQVTLKHQLIMYRKKVPIENISLNKRQGYYSPLTLSSYLYVNNISTSVFVDNYHLSPDDLHTIFLPIRGYYHMMRWFYGKNYNPFETNVQGNVHPLIASMKYHQNKIRNLYLYLQFILQIFTLKSYYLMDFSNKISHGVANQKLSIDHLSSHSHGHSSLSTSINGNHTHSVDDQGHNHGCYTENDSYLNGNGNRYIHYTGDAIGVTTSHKHKIPIGKTNIQINPTNGHIHSISG